jgi:A nuclease family of the HNH/ENDO VII superfamily with conserved AHH
LGEIPIFLPVGVGVGGFVKIGQIIRPISAWTHRKELRKAVEALYGVARGIGETTHHIVALNDRRADRARAILKKFGIGIDEGVNGVFLPASTKSPNPKGALVHSTLHTNAYYDRVEFALTKAKTKADAIRTLKRIRETLLDGTFHHANF